MEITQEDDTTVIAISPSSTNEIETCPTKYKYYKLDGLRRMGKKSEKLERGALFHHMAESYYRGLLKNSSAGLLDLIGEAVEYGRVNASKMDLEPEEIEFTIGKFTAYAHNYYGNDYEPIAVEAPFSQVLYEAEKVKILFEGKIDLVARNKEGKIIVIDHKTAEKMFEPEVLGNQSLGYLSLGISDEFVINQIGWLKKSDTYNRWHQFAPENVINEWRESTIYYTLQMVNYIKSNFFPRNYRSCIWGCPFTDICKDHDNLREGTINFAYTKGEAHNLFEKK